MLSLEVSLHASISGRLFSRGLESRLGCDYIYLHLGRDATLQNNSQTQLSLLLEVRKLPKLEGVSHNYLEGRLNVTINCLFINYS